VTLDPLTLQGGSRTARPRKTLGVLESSALFFMCTRASGNLETTATDLLADFSRFATRDVSHSGLYVLLETLERKGLIEYTTRANNDALGRLRPVRYYGVTDRGRQLAAAEYRDQASIVKEARMAFR
jgi:DNA-binding PadR family transcriptional regulator